MEIIILMFLEIQLVFSEALPLTILVLIKVTVVDFSSLRFEWKVKIISKLY